MQAPRLRPLGIGEILDTAINVYRSRFATLVKAVLLVVAPVQVLSALVTVSLPDTNAFDPGSTTVDTAEAVGAAAATVIIGVLAFVAAQLATATALKVISATYLGGYEDWRTSLRFAVRRLPSILWITFLFFAVAAGLVLVVVVTAVVAGLFAIIPGIAVGVVLPYLYLSWYFAIPAMLLEDVRGTKALGRSRHLVKGRWWRVLLCVIVAGMLGAVVTAAFQGVLLGVTHNVDNVVVEAALGAVVGTIAAGLVTPFSAAVNLVLYFDLRVRKEGFDLELLAQTLGTDVSPELRASIAAAGEGEAAAAATEQPPFWPPPPGWRPGGG